jgi:hypothetical protein
MKCTITMLWVLLALAFARVGGVQAQTIYPPAGPYISPNISDFSGSSFLSTDPVVATYFFYWYSVLSNEHIVNANNSDALTDHPVGSSAAPVSSYPPNPSYQTRPRAAYPGPPSAPNFAYQDLNWQAQEVHNIVAYNIDLMLPDYWGQPGANNWTRQGLQALDSGMDTLENQGQRLPKVGLFYDNTTMQGWDLSNPTYKELFYETIRDFYSLVKPRRWARFNGRVLVELYTSAWPAHIDPSAFTYASTRFSQDFGGNTLFFIGDQGWRNAGCPIDLIYSWGGADVAKFLDVSEIGPGFNNAAVNNGTGTGYRDRGGASNVKYSNDWVAAHQVGHPLIALETWNEYHEATDIAPSVEWGYVDFNITNPQAQWHHFNGYFTKQDFLYQLGRLPDWSGSITWTAAAYNSGPAAVRDGLLNSAESQQRTSNGNYVTFLYNRYLHRAPDSGGYQNWVNVLNSGTARSAVRDSFLNSVEARQDVPNANFVTECYHQFLNREPDSGGFNTYMNQLASGVPRYQVRDAFLNSVEFRNRDLSNLSAVDQRSIYDFAGWPPQ